MVAEQEVSLEFVQVTHLRSVARNASQQGPQDRFVHVGDGGEYNAP